MRNIHLALTVVLCLFLSNCDIKKKEIPSTDNLFAFKEYIAYTTSGRQSVTSTINIQMARALTQFELDQEIPSSMIKISPKVSGKLKVFNQRLLQFIPDENLQPDTTYKITLKLDELYDDTPKDKRAFSFEFKTVTPDFNVHLNALQSYDKHYQYIEGQIEGADVITFAKAKQLISVVQNKKPVSIKWTEGDTASRYYTFRIDSIFRGEEDAKIQVSWDGKLIGARKTKGMNELLIPGRNNFKIIDIDKTRGANASLAINFSDPLEDSQDFKGLVTMQRSGDIRFEVDGNVLYVYPENSIVGATLVEVFQGIKSIDGYKLKEQFSETISFEQLKPALRLVTNGVILPNSESTPFYFEAVNLSHVDVRVIKIYEDNVLDYLQTTSLNSNNTYDLKRVGRRIAKKTITLKNKNFQSASFGDNQWRVHGIDLSEIFTAAPGALYRIEVSFTNDYVIFECTDDTLENIEEDSYDTYYEDDYYYDEYTEARSADEDEREEQYWDNRIYSWRNQVYNWRQENNPCHAAYYQESKFIRSNILGSDLGLIVKKGKDNSYHFAATDIITTTPEANTKITLYNYQKQPIGSVITEATGFAHIQPIGFPVFAVAQKGTDYAYLKLEDGNSLSMSKFDISGKELQKGLKGFSYTERGVHRPGDSIHYTFVLNDENNPLPKGHPVKLEVTDARGKLVYRKVQTLRDTGQQDDTGSGFYYFQIPTSQTAPTGNWNAMVHVGGAKFSKTLKVETIKPNRLKVNLDFKEDIITAGGHLEGSAKVTWLHGAPARHLNIKTDATIQSASSGFTTYPTYNFIDPIRNFSKADIPILDGTLNADGTIGIAKKLELSKRAPGMLKATFVTKAYEGGGDFSLDVVTKDIAPFDYFVGLRSPKSRAYGSYYTDENTTFDVVTTNTQGKAQAHRTLKVKVFKMAWRWWWNRGRDNYASYESGAVHIPVRDFEITTDATGKMSFDINIPEQESGRYLVRVIDEKSGHATGRIAYFYRNWSGLQSDSESAKMLIFSSDKEAYQVGDTATITFPSSTSGRALVTIENGTQVLDSQWVETQQGETRVTLPVTAQMAPNVYINIALLQPHEQTKNDLPIRLYGVIPLLVEDQNTILNPKITMPDVLEPETSYTIKVSEVNARAMTYTIAVVDEGLLDLTRFKTPAIHSHFYSREALGVKTFDMFDDVIGAYSGSVDHIYAIGGGDAANAAKNRKAERFKPVVTYIGPFVLGANEIQTHTLKMPNYVGSVRAMIVAGDPVNAAYGSAEKTVPVRKPLMVLGSLPRKLSPEEHITLPVTVFAMEPKIQQATITIKTSDAFKATATTTKTIRFREVGEQIVPFEFDVVASHGIQKLEIIAEGHGERATFDVEIDVENPNPITQKLADHELSPSDIQTIHYTTFGEPGTNATAIEFSTLPPMDFTKRMQYLIRYPHGCVEQTTSSVFPQLFLDDIFDLTYEQKRTSQENIKKGIKRLGHFQNADGGLGYWQGESKADAWGTTYAGHFMIEAQKKGYALPLTFMSNWLRFQKKTAREWRYGQTRYNTTLTQAYRLFTLALAGQPELASMNRLRENRNLSNDSKWRLAMAYALAGQDKIAQQLAGTATIDFVSDSENSHNYGSVFRNQAMALETMVVLDDPKQKDLAVSISKILSSSRWLSTQETSYALLAMGKMVSKNGGKSLKLTYVMNGKQMHIDTQQAIALRTLGTSDGTQTITVTNEKDNVVYIRLVQSGKLPLGEELAASRNVKVTTVFVDGNNKKVDVSRLQQGQEFIAKISVSNDSRDDVSNVALTQIFPSGWEIVNTRFVNIQGSTDGTARYTDIRDDRVNFYFDIPKATTKTFTVRLNASYLGNYYLPGTQVEAMYDATYYARNKGQWVRIEK